MLIARTTSILFLTLLVLALLFTMPALSEPLTLTIAESTTLALWLVPLIGLWMLRRAWMREAS